MYLPSSARKLADVAVDVIGQCRVSVGRRTDEAREMRQWKYLGSPDGEAAIYNKIGSHVDRLASFLFSPTNLRFDVSFDYSYPKDILLKAEASARFLSKSFKRRNCDIEFGEGVDLALTYGSCIAKTMVSHSGVTASLVMPWQFGVYREDRNNMTDQEALCETTYITTFDLWRRIGHLSNAAELYRRAVAHSKSQGTNANPDDYNAAVQLAGSLPVVQTQAPFSIVPGGSVTTAGSSLSINSPEVAGESIPLHELWVVDDLTGDYTTIQLIEPDIIIAPQFRRHNMFVPTLHPYTMIQPNRQTGYIWGRSEIKDLMKLQRLLKDRMEDIKRLMSLQYDRLLAFTGFAGMNDEAYDQFREAGYIANSEPMGKVEDLTPQMPQNAFQEIETIIKFMDDISGFNNILSGQGEPGVRAGSHASTLMKTASPRLRDRALIVERQCGDLGEKYMRAQQVKKNKVMWPEGEAGNPKMEFLLEQLPEDAYVEVDSHSSSPIYEDDHKDLAVLLSKLKAIDGESLLDILPVPSRDLLKERLKQQKAQEQAMIAAHPELLTAGKGGKKK